MTGREGDKMEEIEERKKRGDLERGMERKTERERAKLNTEKKKRKRWREETEKWVGRGTKTE